jgi:hypothetical protein
MIAAARALRGPARLAAVPAALAVIVMLAYCGWALIVPGVVALAAGLNSRPLPSSLLTEPSTANAGPQPDRNRPMAGLRA